jgi:hypothetical protein
MNLIEFAKQQFKQLRDNSKNLPKDKQPIILKYENMILGICEEMSNEGHSGMSASFYRNVIVQVIDKLLNFKPINPILDKDEDWCDVGEGMYQHKYCSSIFKNKDGKIHDIDSVLKRVKYRIINGEKVLYDGCCWSGSIYKTKEEALVNKNRLRFYIKNFPYIVPEKSYYIDVIEEEIKKDDWIMWINDVKQLEEIEKIYEIVEE